MTTRQEKVLAIVIEMLEKVDRLYDEEFGDDKLCDCGHEYYRHFDTYDDMEPIGCKYSWQCSCNGFKLKENEDGSETSISPESLID